MGIFWLSWLLFKHLSLLWMRSLKQPTEESMLSSMSSFQRSKGHWLTSFLNLMNLKEKNFTGSRKFRIRKRKSRKKRMTLRLQGELLDLMMMMELETYSMKNMTKICYSKYGSEYLIYTFYT